MTGDHTLQTGGHVLQSTRILAVTCLTLVAVGAGTLQAQTRPVQFGGQLSFANDYNFGIGARVVGDLQSMIPGARNWSVIGSFDWFFPGNSLTYWELNGNAVYNFQIAGSTLGPYAGGGLDIAHWSTSAAVPPGFATSFTRLGLNVVGGTTFKTGGSIKPFVELRGELRDGGQFVISGGLLF